MKKILIIEDDVVFGRSIGNWLKKQGMECRHVTALAPARKSLASEEFDLVLADLRLPDGNSTELLRWMHGKCLAVPFLIMTNYGQVENAVEAMQLGAVNYLCKPYNRTGCWRPSARSSAVRSGTETCSIAGKATRRRRCTGRSGWSPPRTSPC